MSLRSYTTKDIPKAETANAAYSQLAQTLAGEGLGLFIVKQAERKGFNIRSELACRIITKAGFMVDAPETLNYGATPLLSPLSLHHDSGTLRGGVTSVHHHRTKYGKANTLFVPLIASPIGFMVDGCIDLENEQLDDSILEDPVYQGMVEQGDDVVFVASGLGTFAHIFMSQPLPISPRTTELSFIDRVAA
jgi:hypothetical protein